MGKFDDILDKVKKAASDRDAETAEVKCPKKRKPAIFFAVLRADTGEPVNGVEIDVSKPTKKKVTSDKGGEAKIDPAKPGDHGIKVILSKELEKEFGLPQPQRISVTKEKATVVVFVLQTLSHIVVQTRNLDTKKPFDGVQLTAGKLPSQNTAGGKAEFSAIPPGRYRLTAAVPKPLENQVELLEKNAVLKTFAPGYTVTWEVDLAPGERKNFLLQIARVRWVEFILAEEGTDKPIKGAKLHAILPGGGKSTVETNDVGNARVTFGKDGKVEIERIELPDPGSVVKVETR